VKTYADPAPVRTLDGQRLSGKYVPALDGIRGLAILAVLVTHSVPRLPATGLGYWCNQLIELGTFGVDLFFVLSGFLITGILLDSKDAPNYFRNFYARRFLRLFPVYYLYLIFIALLLPAIHRAIHTHMPDFGGNWWWFLLYSCNLKPDHAANDAYLGHFWSLAVEEQFYLVWPAVVLLLSRRRLTYFCICAIALRPHCACSLPGLARIGIPPTASHPRGSTRWLWAGWELLLSVASVGVARPCSGPEQHSSPAPSCFFFACYGRKALAGRRYLSRRGAPSSWRLRSQVSSILQPAPIRASPASSQHGGYARSANTVTRSTSSMF
jgi:peptidoglycan/LPS O-acetylase OafA/YrhL